MASRYVMLISSVDGAVLRKLRALCNGFLETFEIRMSREVCEGSEGNCAESILWNLRRLRFLRETISESSSKLSQCVGFFSGRRFCTIRTEISEPMFLRETIHPVFL